MAEERRLIGGSRSIERLVPTHALMKVFLLGIFYGIYIAVNFNGLNIIRKI